MNKRIAQTILTKKFRDWNNSITDISLREDVQKHTIITGGAITSLLLNEKVNDYDIYFTDFATTLKVARYYVEQFKNSHHDRPNGLRDITPEIKIDDNARIRIFIPSEGATGENPENPDLEVDDTLNTTESILESADEVNGEELDSLTQKVPYQAVFLTDNAITLSGGIQLVIRFYGTPEDIHENFDFVHCTNYWTSHDSKLTLKSDAIESILAKELRYIGSLYPVCSFIRIRKFLKRGWYINAGQMLKICLQISELDLSNIKVLEDQLTGVDTAYFTMILDYLKKKSGDEVDLPYLVTLVDRIF